MWSSFISTGVWMAISVVFWAISASCCNGHEKKMWREHEMCTLCMSHIYDTPSSSLLPPPSSLSSIVLSSLFAMPKKDPRDEAGTIVHAVANRVLSDHTAKNIFGNVNYAKHFLQGSVVGAFDGRAPGGKNAVWKLTVDFQMPSDDLGAEVELKRVDVHRQHCVFGPIPAGKNPPCSVTFTDSIGDPDHAMKGSTTYLPNAEGRVGWIIFLDAPLLDSTISYE